jgi:putative flippase GtrA
MGSLGSYLKSRHSAVQLLRYGLVGLASNAVGYAVYLCLTYLGASPKLTMSFLYLVGATLGFWGNRKLTFGHKGDLMGAGGRYVVVQILGYLINLSILYVMVDKAGYPHQWVQAAAIFVVAGFLFVSFKYFVFADLKNSDEVRS